MQSMGPGGGAAAATSIADRRCAAHAPEQHDAHVATSTHALARTVVSHRSLLRARRAAADHLQRGRQTSGSVDSILSSALPVATSITITAHACDARTALRRLPDHLFRTFMRTP
jgi:hypothetical protein